MTKAERDALRAQREREREERERVKEEAKAKREAEKQKREQERRLGRRLWLGINDLRGTHKTSSSPSATFQSEVNLPQTVHQTTKL